MRLPAAQLVRGRGHTAQHHAYEHERPWHVSRSSRARRASAPSWPCAPRAVQSRTCACPTRARSASSRRICTRAARSPSTATTTPCTRARSCAPWRRPRTARRTSPSCSRGELATQHADAARTSSRATALGRPSRRSSTTSSAPRSCASIASRRRHRGRHRARPGGRAPASSPPGSSACRTSSCQSRMTARELAHGHGRPRAHGGLGRQGEVRLLSLIVPEMGGSSRQCATLKPGEPVVVMGPTGAPTEIPNGESVVLCGGGLDNAVLFSIAKAMQDQGATRSSTSRATAAREDIYKVEEIEAATDQVIWSVDGGTAARAGSPLRDRAFVGNVVQAMLAFADGRAGRDRACRCRRARFTSVAIGAAIAFMALRSRTRATACCKPHSPSRGTSPSRRSTPPMQCMMKEICAQCLQKHVDPATRQGDDRSSPLLEPGSAAGPPSTGAEPRRRACAQNTVQGEAHRTPGCARCSRRRE